jgi:hypothetical protein
MDTNLLRGANTSPGLLRMRVGFGVPPRGGLEM